MNHRYLIFGLTLLSFTAFSCGGGDPGSGGGNPMLPFHSGDCMYVGTDSRETVDTDGDNTIDKWITGTTTYDADANIKTIIKETDTDGDTITDLTVRETFTYDGDGKISGIELEEDGVGAPHAITTYAYDANGRVATIHKSKDTSDPHDGVIDTVIRETFTYTDSSYQFTSRLIEEDDDLDGTFSVNQLETLSYLYVADQVAITRDVDVTVPTPYVYEETTTYTYNTDDHLTRQVTQTDTDKNGHIDFASTSTISYNSGGWQTSLNTTWDSDMDGDADGTIRVTTVIDINAMTTVRTIEYLDENGALTKKEITHYDNIVEICSPYLANPHDTEQWQVGKPTYNLP